MARRSNQKRRRDPNAPKKALSAWRIFFNENREELTVRGKQFLLEILCFCFRNKILAYAMWKSRKS